MPTLPTAGLGGPKKATPKGATPSNPIGLASTLANKAAKNNADAPVAVKKATKSSGSAAKDVIKNLVAESSLEEWNPSGVAFQSASGNLAFVESLGDPSVIDSANIAGDSRKLSRIIGYRFKILKDTEIPDFGSTADFNANRLMTAKDLNNWRTAKAGEVVDFTRTEIAALLTRPEFGMEANGGEHAVELRISYAKLKPSKVESVKDLPSVALVLKGNGSIKDLPIRDVLDYEAPEGGSKNGPQVGKRVIKDEFKGTKWENRARVTLRSASTSSSGDNAQRKREAQKDASRAFTTLLNRVASKQVQR